MNALVAVKRRMPPLKLILVCVLIAILLLGYEYAKPVRTVHGHETHEFHVTAVRKKPGVQIPVLSVAQGDSVIVNISSNEPGMVMVHGVDEMPEVEPGRPTQFHMTAKTSGRFSLHLHAADGTQIEIATIAVLPQN
ncbi:hypothetical protein AB6809_34495 [Paraburkholderia sp. RCC_158]|uniref:hypothetical protein n=1 Tax=Paraburkholderia sp. RCC_158 TaxID=3239220 RepID=UPI0035234D4B